MPLSSGTIKFISSLRQKKVRQNYHKFAAEGPRIVGELLGQRRYVVDHLYALESWTHNAAPPGDVPLTVVTPRELSRISQLTTPNEVLAVVGQLAPAAGVPDLRGRWTLYLDGIQSPSNLGALLRIADWFGFGTVVAGAGTADLYNSKSIQASMGSFLRIDYRSADLGQLLQAQPGVPVYAADLAGDNIYRLKPPPEGILVIGAEGPGIGASTAALVDHRLTIPRAAGRQTESLNAAVAAGILMGWLGAGSGSLTE